MKRRDLAHLENLGQGFGRAELDVIVLVAIRSAHLLPSALKVRARLGLLRGHVPAIVGSRSRRDLLPALLVLAQTERVESPSRSAFHCERRRQDG